MARANRAWWLPISLGGALTSLALTSCTGWWCDYPTYLVESGEYESSGGTVVVFEEDKAESTDTFPWGDEPKEMKIDKERGIVTITYERDGVLVEETWAMRDGAIR